jgi:hypothetical protein
MPDPIEEYTRNTCKVSLCYDETPLDPRKEFDNLGVMVCSHRRFNFPNETNLNFDDFGGWDEVRLAIESGVDESSEDGAKSKKIFEGVIIPIYMLKQSNIVIRTHKFSDPWDSGQIGFIFVSPTQIIKEYGSLNPETVAKAQAVLEEEVRQWEAYVTGEIYGYIVKDPEGDEVDSCWGFDDLDYCREQAEAAADYYKPKVEDGGSGI